MTNLEKYNYWLNHENIDPDLKKELEGMNEAEINDAFYTDIAFGTAGIRGVLGAGCNRINIHTIRKATTGFIKYLKKHEFEPGLEGIAISYDNRHMSYELALDSAKMLAQAGIKAYIFESLRPTPELSFAVRHLKCIGGIMITASHNPREYNGYKLYDEAGCQLVPELANEVSTYVNEIEDPLALKTTVEKDHPLIQFIGADVDRAYYDAVLSIQMNKDIKKSVKIVYSPEHGASSIPVQSTLKEAGYNVVLVKEQATPDPDFSNTKSPNPEELKAYELALKYARENDADIILVCDPDGDRMGVACKKDDDYVVLTGNQTGAVLIEYILSQLKERNALPKNGAIFNTVVTSDIGEKIANSYGIEVEKTLTGFKFIGEKVRKYEKNHIKEYVFGYEESYGSLVKPFVRDKDATQACLLLAEASSYYLNQGKTLLNVLNELYAKHGYYADSQTSLVLKGEEGSAKLKALMQGFRDNPIETLCGIKVVAHEDYSVLKRYEGDKESDLVGFVTSDVLKYYFEDGSWIAIRPSGTEPKCKFYYCIIGTSLEDAQAKTKELQNAISELIK